jgi:hypothetical protein
LIIAGILSHPGPGAVPGPARVVDEENLLRDLARAYADTTEGDPAPTVWTPAQVQLRLVDAFGVLRRSPMMIGPHGYKTAWPAIVQEMPALAELEEWTRLRAEWEKEVEDRADRPTSVEIEMAEEALGWGMRYLRDAPLLSDALHLYALCTAFRLNMARLLRKRCLRAAVLIKRRQKDENRTRAARRLDLASAALAWRNRRLSDAAERGVLTVERKERITANARIRLERALHDAGPAVQQIIVRRGDVMPGKVFTRVRLNVWRKEGAAVVAKALRRDKVQVR